MKITTIKINKEINYLSEALQELPKNCLFNKGVVGGGGTTIALKESKNTIICVPFTELIVNKVTQVNNDDSGFYPYSSIGVYAGVSDKEITDYLSNDNEFKKVLVTYNSLERIMALINPAEYDILIDEYHILFTDYSFRADAANTVLRNFREFNSYTFMTATPIEEEFVLDELQDLDVVNAEWEDAQTVEIVPVDCVKGVMKSTIAYIHSFLSGESDGNLYLFVNSVKFIDSILKKVKQLDNTNTRLIYSDYNDTKLRVKRGSTMDAPKKINFITSKAFEGADIYDTEGRIAVVSDANREHTLLDISTKLIQITGRIRDTKYGEKIYHLCQLKDQRYKGNDKLTYTQYKEVSNVRIEEETVAVEALLGVKGNFIQKLIENGSFDFFSTKTGELKLDLNRVKIDLYNYKIANEVYKNKVNRRMAYDKMSKLVVKNDVKHLVDGVFGNYDDVENSFKATVEALYTVKDDVLAYMQLMLGAVSEYPYIEDAIEKLGFEMIESLKYRTSNVKRALDNLEIADSQDTVEFKVNRALLRDDKFKRGTFYPSAKIKDVLTNLYDELGVNANAKATDIAKYYMVEAGSKRIDGVKVRGFVVLHNLSTIIK